MEALKDFLKIDHSYGDGSGDVHGSGHGSGSCYGYGYGHGYGSGYGYGYGYGYGDGSGIKQIAKQPVAIIDDIQTIISVVKNNIAKGFILNPDLTLRPCWIAKRNNLFAHGDTLKDAVRALREKVLQSSSIEERIAKFKEEFPCFNKKISAKKLFEWHGILTGSCKAGREAWCKNHGINLTQRYTIHDFIKLTENSYGGDIVKKLK